jgi:YebC/PmpR family DNA-binding regulatory protein
MAGHSKFKNIQHRKGAQDKKRAKIFTKLVREIVAATKIGGIDPNSNPRLRNAILAARSQNLPKERIEKAISQGSDNNVNDNYNEIRYEGFVPGGIAIIVEALTDNKNRTASEVRSAFTKFGGNLGETGSVSFMFEHYGMIEYSAEKINSEQIFDHAINAGASDVESNEDIHVIYTTISDFSVVVEHLTEKCGTPDDSYLGWKPQSFITVSDEEKAGKLIKLIDALEDSDDVQKVFYNYEFSDELYKKLIQE